MYINDNSNIDDCFSYVNGYTYNNNNGYSSKNAYNWN